MPESKRESTTLRVEHEECGGQYVFNWRIDPTDPPETVSGKCYADHPGRGCSFDGCGEDDVDLKIVEVDP